MSLTSLIDFFIHPYRLKNFHRSRRARLFVRACLLTSLFSASYIGFSHIFEFERGVYYMIYNAFGFLILAMLGKTKISIGILGNIYIFVGASAVVTLAYYSGGIWSALYPWIVAIPVLALLVVGRYSAIFWGIVSFFAMVWFGILDEQGVELPVEYNTEYRTMWFLSIVPGLLLIVLSISFVFEHTQTKALEELEKRNIQLREQKDTISEQSKRLEKLVDEKDYIIRILAHDLRSPLNNISSLVSLMSIENTPARISEYQKMILNASQNARHLVDRVLEMDASSQENVHLKQELTLIDPWMDRVIEESRSAGQAKNIQIILNNNTSGLSICVDTTYFRLIFENLLSNAIKFSETNSKVELEIEQVDDVVEFKVIDYGPGVEPIEQVKLFRKFSKLSARPTAGEMSVGLGLSLVKRYVELMNGRVHYEDIEGKGGVFVVSFKIATDEDIPQT